MDDAGPDDDAPAGADAAIAPTVPGRKAVLASGSDPQATWDLPEADRAVAITTGPGATIGRFVLRTKLGEGGMGVVFAADDPDLGRQVAVKLVRDDASPALRARLLREAQAMARLEHPNTVRVFEVGAAAGRLYVAMELVDGETLTAWLARAPRTWREIVGKFVELGAGLAAVHKAGLVHRDFKPDNVLVDRSGHARVADFGLARFDGAGDDPGSPALAAPLTRTGAMMGTPGYMAPEQQFGSDVDARADQYSFCVALREALGAGLAKAPRGVRSAISRGLSYDASERFPSLDALLATLARTIAPRRGAWIAAGAVVLAAAGAVAVAVVAERGPVVERETGALPPPLVARAAIVDATLAPTPPSPVNPYELAKRMRAPTEALIRAVGAGAARPDAGVPAVRATLDARPKAIASADQDAGVTFLPPPPLVPTSPEEPVVHPPPGPMDKAHLPAVRAATRDLDYRAFPLADLDADIAGSIANGVATRDKIVAEAKADDKRVPIITTLIGLMRRRAGDCGRARVELQAALDEFAKLDFLHDDQMMLHAGRAHFGIGLCQLEAGNASASFKHLEQGIQYIGWGKGGDLERSEPQLALGIAIFEAGDRMKSHGYVHSAGIHGDDRVHAAMEGWMKVVGMTWDETWDWR
ncbi:MAG TPA: serine/threonine-protein kinase [Kofleriaceae bacterium]|jgi:serine/threonine-protein kinase|nr:serine/threonine-protein kinase [Kofleriaceae bacterium]